jgi:hypothetical protein
LSFIDRSSDIENQIIDWINTNLPKFKNEYKENLYGYEEIQKYNKQNYIMGFVFPQPDDSLKLDLTDEWFDNFNDVVKTLSKENAVNEDDMQIDNRNLITE